MAERYSRWQAQEPAQALVKAAVAKHYSGDTGSEAICGGRGGKCKSSPGDSFSIHVIRNRSSRLPQVESHCRSRRDATCSGSQMTQWQSGDGQSPCPEFRLFAITGGE